jgi:DNA polymerase-3 subunit alpha
LSIEKLIETAREHNVDALALTDINNSTGMISFVKQCRKNGIKPIAGIEIRNGNKYLYT